MSNLLLPGWNYRRLNGHRKGAIEVIAMDYLEAVMQKCIAH